jgi:hypothetical protein
MRIDGWCLTRWLVDFNSDMWGSRRKSFGIQGTRERGALGGGFSPSRSCTPATWAKVDCTMEKGRGLHPVTSMNVAIHLKCHVEDLEGLHIFSRLWLANASLYGTVVWSLCVVCYFLQQIEDLVREDSRIDQYQKKVRGEMKVVWEWQGKWGAWRCESRAFSSL